MDCIQYYDSPLGRITLASGGDALIGLWFENQKYYGSALSGRATERTLPVFGETARWLDDYFSGRDPGRLPPLSPRGTDFQRRVWALLAEIPRGQTVTYGWLAARLEERTGRHTSPRAVGGADGRNPISILIPCHRVVGADGGLTGYAGGVERKRALLSLERGGKI